MVHIRKVSRAKKGAAIKWICLVALVALILPLPVRAASEPVPVSTAEDLAAMADDPAGSYILVNDIDMTGIDWKPIDFSGSFDGNGHSILNLSLSQPGDTTANSFDGNYKVYDTAFVGLFGALKNATVRDLNLINVRGLVEIDRPCFLGGLAGYSELSTITGCYVLGTLEIRAFDRMYGVGGIVGYGNGTAEGCKADVILICTDTDKKTLDESFLGGIFSTGFMDVKNCQVTIDGYCSDYGYVHTGGITGMYLQYPLGSGRTGKITGNHVEGKITFFEANSDRRAYCRPYAGEELAFDHVIEDNTSDFLRDEKWDYDTELRPEMCQTPVHTIRTVAAGCNSYGYTEYHCETCGYTYRDQYTLFQHEIGPWEVVIPATEQAPGQSRALCVGCGKEYLREDPKLEPAPTPAPTQTPTLPETAPAPTSAAPSTPAADPAQDPALPFFLGLLGILCLIAVVLLMIRICRPSRKKRRR